MEKVEINQLVVGTKVEIEQFVESGKFIYLYVVLDPQRCLVSWLRSYSQSQIKGYELIGNEQAAILPPVIKLGEEFFMKTPLMIGVRPDTIKIITG